jgi:hypothetical protein
MQSKQSMHACRRRVECKQWRVPGRGLRRGHARKACGTLSMCSGRQSAVGSRTLRKPQIERSQQNIGLGAVRGVVDAVAERERVPTFQKVQRAVKRLPLSHPRRAGDTLPAPPRPRIH